MLILVNLYNPEFLLHISSPFVLECSFAHEKLKHVFRGKMVRQLVLRYVSHLAPDVLKQLILLRRNCRAAICNLANVFSCFINTSNDFTNFKCFSHIFHLKFIVRKVREGVKEILRFQNALENMGRLHYNLK